MATTNTHLAWGAILLGNAFAVGTGCVLFSDVKQLSDVNTDHMMTGLVFLGTLAAGHMFGNQARQWRLISALGLAVLFVAGTTYCVTTSAARNAETSSGKLAKVRTANGDRAAAEQDVADAKQVLKDAVAHVRKECGTGNGARCKGSRAAVEVAQAAVTAAEDKLGEAPVPVVENAGMAHAALVYSILTGLDPKGIEKGLDLLWPFIKSVFLEVATLTFFGIGLAHKVEPKTRLPVSTAVPVEFHLKHANENNVLDWVREFRRFHGRNPQIPEVQQQFQLPRTTAWRRIKSA